MDIPFDNPLQIVLDDSFSVFKQWTGVNCPTNFWKFSSHHICVVVTGKRVNRDIGLGLEIQVDYFLYGYNLGLSNGLKNP